MLERSTYYILDAQGNQLSMYDHKVTDNAVVYYLADRNIYGSSRLGSLRDTVNMFIPTNLPSYGVVGNRNYELSNHLGNVLAVVNDIVYPISDDSTTILSYEVGLTMVSDYSPFGVQLDGRTIQNEMYSPVSSDTSSQTTPIIAEIYKNEFDSPPATTSPYTGATTTLDGNLSNPVWTSSTGDFTNYNSTGAGSGKSISIKNASPDTSYVTLSLDVDNGYLLDITSYSFAHRSSTTGYDSYKLVVNGIEIGTGSIYVASSGSTLQSTGVVNVSNVVSGVTGTVNVVLKLYGGLHGSTGTFRMDDFILNGYTQEENAGNGSGNGYVVMGGYRYGFENQEVDNEVYGEGNYVNFKYRGYNPRIARFFAVDPLADKFPHMTPYQFAGNKPIWSREIEGLESEVDAEAVELEMGEDFTLDESQMPADKDFDYEAGGNLYQKAVNESGLDPLQFSQLYDITFNKGVPNASLTEKGKEILGNNSQNAINGFANISRTFNRLAINASAEEAYQFNDHIMSQNISATGDLRGFYNSLVPYMNRSRMAHAGNLGLAVTALGSALTGNPVMGGYGGFNVSQRTSFNFSRFNFSNNMRSIGPSPNFIVSPNGTAFPVPNNSIGPFPALNNRGIQFVNGNSGFGLSSRVHGFRFMDPITSGKYLYPNGYGNYFNSSNQSIHPYSGNMLSRSSDWWHIH